MQFYKKMQLQIFFVTKFCQKKTVCIDTSIGSCVAQQQPPRGASRLLTSSKFWYPSPPWSHSEWERRTSKIRESKAESHDEPRPQKQSQQNSSFRALFRLPLNIAPRRTAPSYAVLFYTSYVTRIFHEVYKFYKLLIKFWH